MTLRLLLILAACCVFAGCSAQKLASPGLDFAPQDGDFVFQSLPHNAIIDAIEGSTGSPFSHCGIVAHRDGEWKVIEAIGPVKETPLSEWIAQGRDHAYVVCRLRPPLQAKVHEIIAAAARYEGRPYDIHYDFDDAKIYCSELLWKATRDATGIKLGKVQKLGELKWQPYEAVIRRIEAGNLPLDRGMITPQAVADDPRLEEVFRHRMK